MIKDRISLGGKYSYFKWRFRKKHASPRVFINNMLSHSVQVKQLGIKQQSKGAGGRFVAPKQWPWKWCSFPTTPLCVLSRVHRKGDAGLWQGVWDMTAQHLWDHYCNIFQLPCPLFSMVVGWPHKGWRPSEDWKAHLAEWMQDREAPFCLFGRDWSNLNGQQCNLC